jgi:hypothetical protein
MSIVHYQMAGVGKAVASECTYDHCTRTSIPIFTVDDDPSPMPFCSPECIYKHAFGRGMDVAKAAVAAPPPPPPPPKVCSECGHCEHCTGDIVDCKGCDVLVCWDCIESHSNGAQYCEGCYSDGDE